MTERRGGQPMNKRKSRHKRGEHLGTCPHCFKRIGNFSKKCKWCGGVVRT